MARQTYNNIEYIIIDGGSKDGSIELIKENEKIISSWCSEPDKGIYNAMNKGVEKMTGDWCLFMNSGDSFYDERAIEWFVNAEKTQNTALVYGDTCLVFEPYGVVNRRLGVLKGQAQTGICHQSSFIRCDVMKKYKYDESYKIVADVNFFQTLLNNGFDFSYLPQITSRFDAFGGVSSKPSFKIMNEYNRAWGVTKYSPRYVRDLLKYALKILGRLILPVETRKRMMYKKLKKRFEK